jgi:predicted porin
VTIRMTSCAAAVAGLLCAAGTAQAQSTVSIYGILDASVSYAKGVSAKSAVRSGDLLAPRLGFKGVEDLGGGLKANFALEAGLAHDTGIGAASNTNNQASGATAAGGLQFNRQSWVGVEGAWGELRLGRNFNPTYRQYIAYDPFMGGGIGASQAAQSSLATYGYSPAGLRHSNAIEYWLPAKGPLTGQFMYAMGENASGVANKSDGNYLSGRLAYQWGAANIGFAAGQMKNLAKGDIDEYVLGANYRVGDAVLMGMYTRSKEGVGTKQEGWLIGGTLRQQAMEYRLALSGSNTKAASGASIGRSQKLAAIGRYHFSKRSSVYLMGVVTRNSNGAAMVPLGTLSAAEMAANHNARAISVGLTHTF